MNGKNRCRILKDIRKRIAEENGIEYITSECKYKGDCLGTCPKCDSEVRYLEQELERKRGLGKRVAIAGIAVGITATAAGCTPDIASLFNNDTLQGDMMLELQGEPTQEISKNDNSIPNGSVVSEIVTNGELVEIIGEMPETSLPEIEISDPYEGLLGEILEFPYTLEEALSADYNELMTAMKSWSRKYIDYEWREHIIDRTANKTVFLSADRREITVVYDDNGDLMEIRIPEPERMGDMP
jgi:hypothetical protein